MDRIRFDVPVKNITWHTNSSGMLLPLLRLDKSYKAQLGKKSLDFDSISMQSLAELKERSSGIGCRLQVEFDEELNVEVKSVYDHTHAYNLPVRCESCKKGVFQYGTDFICVNHLCHAQARTAIFKLILSCVMKPLSNEDIRLFHRWLTEFPSNKDFTDVDHLYTFLNLFSQEWNNIGTENRLSILRGKLQDDGMTIFKLEENLKRFLTKGLKPVHFWHVIGLPELSEKDINKLSKHDVYTKGVKKLPKISKIGNLTIGTNKLLVHGILTELIKFKNRK